MKTRSKCKADSAARKVRGQVFRSIEDVQIITIVKKRSTVAVHITLLWHKAGISPTSHAVPRRLPDHHHVFPFHLGSHDYCEYPEDGCNPCSYRIAHADGRRYEVDEDETNWTELESMSTAQ